MSIKETSKKKAKSDKERARSLYQRRTAAGWKKTWVNPETLSIARQFGGVQKLGSALEQQSEELTKLRLENQANSQAKTQLNKDLDELSNKHQALSEEHKTLQTEHQKLHREQEEAVAKLDRLKRRSLLSRLLNRSE